jgi:hypothetical protein
MLEQMALEYIAVTDTMATAPICRKTEVPLKKKRKSPAGISTNNLIFTAHQGTNERVFKDVVSL